MKLPCGIFQRVVDVPGFRVFVGGSGDILHAHLFRKLAELFAVAIIQQVNGQFVLRPVNGLGGEDGQLHNIQGFVV